MCMFYYICMNMYTIINTTTIIIIIIDYHYYWMRDRLLTPTPTPGDLLNSLNVL